MSANEAAGSKLSTSGTSHVEAKPGQIVILNGVARSGKTSIGREIQASFPGVWMNLGVDSHIKCTPAAYQPGVGLRPGKPEWSPPDLDQRLAAIGRVPLGVLEELVPLLYRALYESVAAHARLGLNVVVDVSHHDAYSKPRAILPDCAQRLDGLPVLFVGVRCPTEVIWQRRRETWGQDPKEVDAGTRGSVELGQKVVHAHGGYDLEVDTSVLSPAACAALILRRLDDGPPGSRFREVALTAG